ncbi:MAG: hypothetical protein NUV91_07680, partial [Candidatus Omnitrophica bacterium]|nr:hypothetical protein [Candidatus Omnitrophota bacterium]
MFKYLQMFSKKFSFLLSGPVILFLLAPPIGLKNVEAQSVEALPPAGHPISLSQPFAPVLLKGIKVFPNEPLRFDFIMDRGDVLLEGKPLEEEYIKLIKYFLASLTVPQEDLWVNLSPDEPDRIIPHEFGKTSMGQELLVQDYILKQITASLMNPEEKIGQEFWQKIYKEAQQRYGTTQIPLNTFHKVWIVPQRAQVYENEAVAVVTNAHLKVMLESDYWKEFKKSKIQENDDQFTSEIVREIILPVLEEEINEGEHFAPIRQIFHSLILAIWFKENLKESLLGKVYVGRNKVGGVDSEEIAAKEKVYEQYLDAFKKGVYNFIKEDYDPKTQQVIPRRYFSGGTWLAETKVAGGGLLADARLARPEVVQAFLFERHDTRNRQIDRVLEAIAEKELPAAGYSLEKVDGRYPFLELVRTRGGEVIIDRSALGLGVEGQLILRERNGRLVVIHPDFAGIEHAGLGTFGLNIFAADEFMAAHEEAEQTKLLDGLVEMKVIFREDIGTPEARRKVRAYTHWDGREETKSVIRDRQNSLIILLNHAHEAGREAQAVRGGITYVPGPQPTLLLPNEDPIGNFELTVAAEGAVKIVRELTLRGMDSRKVLPLNDEIIVRVPDRKMR